MNLLIRLFYQPFLNILVGSYYLLDIITGGRADMGIAVIIFTLIVRILLLPLTISGTRSRKEKHQLEEAIKKIKRKLSADPVARDAKIKKLMKKNRRVVISSTITLAIQTLLALILWRIFAVGLLGEDLHLLYDFMPQPQGQFNLMFLTQYDLTHPNAVLNLLQSVLIFILELEFSLFSVFPVSRRDVILTQFTLPLGSFVIFSQLPAGKKLFIITSLIFSIVYTTTSQLRYWWLQLKEKWGEEEKVGS